MCNKIKLFQIELGVIAVYKKFFTWLAIGITAVLASICLPFMWSVGYVSFPYTRHNKDFDKEQNKAMIHLVEQVFDARYKTHSVETLEKIFTEELLENYDNYIHNFFQEGPFYYNKNYMKTIHFTEENQWTVIVSMHEGGLMSGNSYFLHVTIIKTEDGSYLISSIGLNV